VGGLVNTRDIMARQLVQHREAKRLARALADLTSRVAALEAALGDPGLPPPRHRADIGHPPNPLMPRQPHGWPV